MSICAIIVTHNPNLAVFQQLLASCLPQVGQAVILDNCSAEAAPLQRLVSRYGAKVALLKQPENLGIAAAQNIGIAWARGGGCSHLLFLDQDSIPQPGMVATLLQALQRLQGASLPVAAVGPSLLDRRNGTTRPFVNIRWCGVTRKICQQSGKAMLETDFLIASGMLAPLTSFAEVGLLEDGLFIDNVDLEWCFRARAKGFKLYGVCNAVLEHNLGDQVLAVGGRSIYRHNPLRQYYIMRNRIHLYKRPYAPRGWILQDVLRAALKVILFSLVFPPRRENIRMMLQGVRDALKGRYGRYNG